MEDWLDYIRSAHLGFPMLDMSYLYLWIIKLKFRKKLTRLQIPKKNLGLIFYNNLEGIVIEEESFKKNRPLGHNVPTFQYITSK